MINLDDNLIIDIDGTLLDGSNVINNSIEFIKNLNELDINYIFATNSIKSHDEQIERFKNHGINIPTEKIYTPIDSINQMILKNNISKVMCIGSSDEIYQIKAQNSDNDPEIIILLDFEKMNYGYNLLQKIIDKASEGCSIVSASSSNFYLKNGKKQIDTGAFMVLIESITGKKIDVLGKPSKDFFLNGKSLLGANSITVIGDDWKTDILGAKSVGFGSILIKSGKYVMGDEYRGVPDYCIKNLMEMIP